jgi:hypothetical protein
MSFLEDSDIKDLTSRFYQDDFNDFLETLLERDCIDKERDIGITKQVIDSGYDSLSEKQKMCFVLNVIKPNYIECQRCNEFISWNEVMFIMDDEDNYCSYCRQAWDND